MQQRYALLFAAASLLCSTQLSAQYSITGSVKTEKGAAIEMAYVSVLNGADSSLVTSGQTNELGGYRYDNIAAGKYIIDVQALGYKQKKHPVLVTGNTEIESILLTPTGREMEEVVVTAQKNIISTELGKTVVHVRESMKAGNNLLDILRNMPGVVVGADGEISITGKEGIIVLVDDKPVRLAGRDLAEYLKGVDATEVAKIELMTQPSAKYDAEGNAGIINIKMDKNRKQGWGGVANATYSQGKYPFVSANSNITYRKNKLAYTLNPGYYQGQGFLRSEKETRSKQDGETVAVITEEAFRKEVFPDYSLKAGIDYDMNDRTNMSFAAKGIYHTNREVDEINSVITNQINGQRIYNYSENKNGHTRSHIELDGYLKHAMDSNRNIQVNAGCFINRRDLYQKLNSADYDANGVIIAEPLILDNTVPDRMNLYVIKADYETKAGKVKLECGVKGNYMTMNEENRFDRYTNGQWINDTTRTNKFLYNEAISAAYITSTTAINKLQLQGGLRVEHTYAEGDQVTQDVQFIRNYISLFPTAFANYKINDNHTVEANYGRRVRRPNYRDLNPFVRYASQYNIFTGNPMIAPMFTHNVELKHNFKGRFITTANWSETLGTFIEQLVFDNSTNVATHFYANSGRNSRVSLYGHYTNQVTGWLNLGLMAGGHYTEFEADYNGRHHYGSATGFYASIDTQFSFKNGWSAAAHSRYAGPYRSSVVQMTGGSLWLNAEVTKTLFKDTATIRVSVQDPFYTYRYVFDMQQPEASVASSSMFNTQSIGCTFSYNFGKREELRRREALQEGRM
jgi:iron complex outermembrane receptor protein